MPRPTLIAVSALAIVAAAVGFAAGRATAPTHSISGRHQVITAALRAPTTMGTTTTIPGSFQVGDFAGQWFAHDFGMTIYPDGYGSFSWPAYRSCAEGGPPCDYADPYGHIDGAYALFALTPPKNNIITGTIFESWAPSAVPDGPLTIRFDPVDHYLRVTLPAQQPITMCGTMTFRLPAGLYC